jgi:hypothetical protein
MSRFNELFDKTLFDPKLAGLSYSEVIRRPKELSDLLWQEIAHDDVTAPFIAMAEKLAPPARRESSSDQ